jgi:hypothetical protein
MWWVVAASARTPDLVLPGHSMSTLHVGPLTEGGPPALLWSDERDGLTAWAPHLGILPLQTQGAVHGWEDTDGDGLVELLLTEGDRTWRWPDEVEVTGHQPAGSTNPNDSEYRRAVPVGDVDGDGAPDHVVGGVLRRGSGVELPLGLDGRPTVVGDLDGDERTDFLLYDGGGYYATDQLQLHLTTDLRDDEWPPRWSTGDGPYVSLSGAAMVPGPDGPALIFAGTHDYHRYRGMIGYVARPLDPDLTLEGQGQHELRGYYQASAVLRELGDLDGDGDVELLFHHPPQAPRVWDLEGRRWVQWSGDGFDVEHRPNAVWNLAVTGDLDEDGLTDVAVGRLWGNPRCGQLAIWFGAGHPPADAVEADAGPACVGDDSGTVPPDVREREEGCGCAAGPRASPLWFLPFALGIRRARRRRPDVRTCPPYVPGQPEARTDAAIQSWCRSGPSTRGRRGTRSR